MKNLNAIVAASWLLMLASVSPSSALDSATDISDKGITSALLKPRVIGMNPSRGNEAITGSSAASSTGDPSFGTRSIIAPIPAGDVFAPARTAGPAAVSTKKRFHIDIGPERMSGNTAYKIGYPINNPDGTRDSGYFPFSMLDWPLDIWLVKAEARFDISDSWRLNGTIKKSFAGSNRVMKDYDWLTPENPGQLDYYSELRISGFDAWIFDFNADWIFVKRGAWSLFTGLGYQYQMFDYESKLNFMSSPSMPGVEIYGDDRVAITYDMRYSMPYIRVGTEWKIEDKLEVEGSFAWSPLVKAKDEDRHLLRENGGKTAKGNMDGNAYMINLSGKYFFKPSWYLKSGFSLTLISVDGQEQQVYGNGMQLGSVRETSESFQVSGSLTVGYAF